MLNMFFNMKKAIATLIDNKLTFYDYMYIYMRARERVRVCGVCM